MLDLQDWNESLFSGSHLQSSRQIPREANAPLTPSSPPYGYIPWQDIRFDSMLPF